MRCASGIEEAGSTSTSPDWRLVALVMLASVSNCAVRALSLSFEMTVPVGVTASMVAVNGSLGSMSCIRVGSMPCTSNSM